MIRALHVVDSSEVGVLPVLSVLGISTSVDDSAESSSLSSNKVVVGVVVESIIEDDNVAGLLLPYICFTSLEFGLRHLDYEKRNFESVIVWLKNFLAKRS